MDDSNVQINALELRNKNGIFHSTLTRPITKHSLQTNRSQIRLDDDPDSNNSSDYVLNGEKVAIYDDKLVFKKNGKIFTLRGYVLKMITEYKFNTTESPDAKLIIDITDEMHFVTNSRGKSFRGRILTNNYFEKGAVLASGLTTIFSETSNELCNILKLFGHKY